MTTIPQYTAEMTAYYPVYIIGGVMSITSLGCSFLVTYFIYQKYHEEGQIAISLRFPLYIAITDISLSIAVIGNQLYPALYRKNWEGTSCTITAYFVGLSGFLNMTVVTSVALLTYLRTCREWHIDTGKYDWKLLGYVFASSFIWTCVQIPGYGPSRYWCYQGMYTYRKEPGIVVLCYEVLMFLITSICFLAVITNIETFRRKGSRNSNSIENRASRRMMLYIIGYFVQWGGVVPYCLGSLFDIYHDVIYIITTFTMNCGGVLNLAAYFLNQRK